MRPLTLLSIALLQSSCGGGASSSVDGGADLTTFDQRPLDLTIPNDAESGSDAAANPPDGAAPSAARKLAMALRGSPNFLFGMGNDLANDHNMDGAYTLGPTLDLHYAYLVGLQHVCVSGNCQISNQPQNQCGWPDWNANGTFVDILDAPALAHGTTPMFTLYAMATCGEDNMAALTDDAYMGPYWDGAKLLFQRLALFDHPAVVHLEPDFWGYAQQKSPGGDATKLPVHVNLAADCAALPNDMTGMGACLVKLARTYAPKVALGFHASVWAGSSDSLIAFLKQIGATDGDFIVTDMLDRDAGCFEAGNDPNCQGRGTTGFYWDESNQTSPNFAEHLAWVKSLHDGLGLPVMWWQVPFGVPSAMPGGAPGHYRDNRVHYMFAHVDELIAAGGVGAVFGTGAGNQTYITSDGDQFKNAVTNWYQHPVALP